MSSVAEVRMWGRQNEANRAYDGELCRVFTTSRARCGFQGQFQYEEQKTMENIPWAKEFPGNITVCDTAGVILEMNDGAARAFAKEGGRGLIGSNLLDCHPEPSRSKLQELLGAEKVNAYTIEKGGVKKLIYQAPWYENGEYRGLVEVVLVLPDVLPHFVRDGG